MAKKYISPIFCPFLTIFSIFHLKFLQLCKILPSYIFRTPQVMFGLVNNDENCCQKLSSKPFLRGCVRTMFSVGAALRDDDWCRQPSVWRQHGVGAEQLRGAVCRGRGLDQGGGRLLPPLTGHDGLARSAAGGHYLYISLYTNYVYSVLFYKWRPSRGNIVTRAWRHSWSKCI